MQSELTNFYGGKRVLVTGHTGFKGSWLTEWLLMLGARVTGLALPPPTEPALFEQLGLANRCDHRIGDIRNRELVHRVVHEVQPDVIFHLAAQPLVRSSYAQPVETYETNVMGTVHVLEALRDADWPCAAVMITTDKVYENKEWVYAYRENDPLGGYDPYSSSKACAELVIQSYRQSFFNPKEIVRKIAKGGKQRGLVGVASARAGNVIGGGDWAQDRIVPDCMRALAKGKPIQVRNPDATRPWQHVLEPLSGYLLLAMRINTALTIQPDSLSVLASAFNFGPATGCTRSVQSLVKDIVGLWPGAWEAHSGASAPHEGARLNLASEKACQAMGWSPRWSTATTIAMTVSWYRTVHEQGTGAASCLTRQQVTDYMRSAP